MGFEGRDEQFSRLKELFLLQMMLLSGNGNGDLELEGQKCSPLLGLLFFTLLWIFYFFLLISFPSLFLSLDVVFLFPISVLLNIRKVYGQIILLGITIEVSLIIQRRNN